MSLFELPITPNPNHHQQDLPNSIQQVFTEFIVSQKALSDLSEEAEH